LSCDYPITFTYISDLFITCQGAKIYRILT
jgi:hypothetical protein